jgi:hypothetical protein
MIVVTILLVEAEVLLVQVAVLLPQLVVMGELVNKWI